MDIKVGRNWGLFAAASPWSSSDSCCSWCRGLTLVSIAVIAGCMFLAAGIVDAYAYFKYREAEGLSGWALAYAVCDIILGVLFIVHPIASAVVIPWVMGIFVVAYGIFEIVAAVRFHDALPGWGWVLFAGIVVAVLRHRLLPVAGHLRAVLGLLPHGPRRADGRLRRVAAPGDHRGPHPLGSAHAREELRSEEATPARRGVGGTTAAPVIP